MTITTKLARPESRLLGVTVVHTAFYAAAGQGFFSFWDFALCWLWGLTQALGLALPLALASSYYGSFGSGCYAGRRQQPQAAFHL
jgi:hypothetical protein